MQQTASPRRRVDFRRPEGAAALFEPDSVTWRVYKNPISLFAGGIAAVVLELAEPRVRTGVWEHSSFPTDPIARMRRTGLAAQITVYGPVQAAEQMIRGVVRMHDRVGGLTPEGVAYRANETELLDWVQVTASYGFLEAYARFARPLSDSERDRYYAESQASARLYGATGAPKSLAEQRAMFEAMRPRLVPHPIIFEFLELVMGAPIFPKPLRGLQASLIRAGVDLLPTGLAKQLELGPEWALGDRERWLIKRLGALADRVPLPAIPPVQACQRLGLPVWHLYR